MEIPPALPPCVSTWISIFCSARRILDASATGRFTVVEPLIFNIPADAAMASEEASTKRMLHMLCEAYVSAARCCNNNCV